MKYLHTFYSFVKIIENLKLINANLLIFLNRSSCRKEVLNAVWICLKMLMYEYNGYGSNKAPIY